MNLSSKYRMTTEWRVHVYKFNLQSSLKVISMKIKHSNIQIVQQIDLNHSALAFTCVVHMYANWKLRMNLYQMSPIEYSRYYSTTILNKICWIQDLNSLILKYDYVKFTVHSLQLINTTPLSHFHYMRKHSEYVSWNSYIANLLIYFPQFARSFDQHQTIETVLYLNALENTNNFIQPPLW